MIRERERTNGTNRNHWLSPIKRYTIMPSTFLTIFLYVFYYTKIKILAQNKKEGRKERRKEE